MTAGFLALFITDAAIVVALRALSKWDWLRDRVESNPWITAVAAVGAISAHASSSSILAESMTAPEWSGIAVTAFVVFGVPPIGYAFYLAAAAFNHDHVNTFYSWDSRSCRVDSDLSMARTLRARNQVNAAAQQYRRYYAQDPRNAKPLLEAAAMFESVQRYREAAAYLREAVAAFAHDDAVWMEASLRLANLHEHALADTVTTKSLLREMVRRQPNSDLGRLAGARLLDLATAS